MEVINVSRSCVFSIRMVVYIESELCNLVGDEWSEASVFVGGVLVKCMSVECVLVSEED